MTTLTYSKQIPIVAQPEVLVCGAGLAGIGAAVAAARNGAKVLALIDETGLPNIQIHPDDVRPLLRWLPENALDRTFVLFPDPWPKVRHRKRRLVATPLLDQLARVLKPGAELRLATDIGDYARTMLVALMRHPSFRWTATGPTDWRIRPADWPPTRYEAKAVREGRRCTYLRFERV